MYFPLLFDPTVALHDLWVNVLFSKTLLLAVNITIQAK